MAVEPAPSKWRIPTPRRTGAEGLIGVGADLEAGTVLAAYRTGAFPMPVDGLLAWFSPDPRAVIPLPGTACSRTLRRARRRFDIRVDTAFDAVVAGCADPRRPGRWITPAMVAAYRLLYDLGWAHSVEAWTEEGRLGGGLFGVAVGGLFAAESMFHVVTDASKAAVVGLIEALGAENDSAHRVLDVQWSSDHLTTLGAVEISRTAYLSALPRALALSAPVAFGGRAESGPTGS
jgi:leucyl/phenylalanyl-tRNA--protein transferase